MTISIWLQLLKYCNNSDKKIVKTTKNDCYFKRQGYKVDMYRNKARL